VVVKSRAENKSHLERVGCGSHPGKRFYFERISAYFVESGVHLERLRACLQGMRRHLESSRVRTAKSL
jgi:hypothetical protein